MSSQTIRTATLSIVLASGVACSNADDDEIASGNTHEGTSHAQDTDAATSSVPGTTSDDETVTETDSAPDDCGAEGSFRSRFTVAEDECEAAAFLGYDDVMTVEIELSDGVTVSISSDPGLEPVSGMLESGCVLTTTGQATVAAYPNTQVDWDGTLTADGFTGTLTLGGDAGLPGGCPVVYVVDPDGD